jgi:hypothetical protein
MLQRIARTGGLVAVVGCLASTAWAQGGNATISGTVYDQAKAVLPGVVVTATNEATGVTRDVVTGSEGRFSMPTMNPGTYTVRVELPGFQGQAQQGLVLRVGQETTLDFTLSVATVAESITVTAEAPLIETTASQVGAVVTDRDIDSLPSQGRNQLSLVQLIPGVTPNLATLNAGDFEGDSFSSNGQAAASNAWNVDGAPLNQTNGGGSGAQVRLTLDSTAEFQVLTHQYTAESGAATGVIVNAVTKSGTNELFGRGFYYFQNEKLYGRDHFLPDDEPEPVSGQKVFGGNIGGPILRDKAFFFFNLERINQEGIHIHTMPPEAAPLAVSYSAQQAVRRMATFLRTDYTTGRHNFRFSWAREPKPSIGENFECCQTLDQRQFEASYGDRMYNIGLTSVLGNRATNEVTVSKVGEERFVTNLAMTDIDPADWFKDGWVGSAKYIGLNGRDQFDIGSSNNYADFTTGLASAHNGRKNTLVGVKNVFTYAGGSHTWKAGAMYDYRQGWPQMFGNNDNGTFVFRHNTPFNPANGFSYPSEFSIQVGDIEFYSKEAWWNAFVQDQWRMNEKLTLNMGVRWDYQELPSNQKDAFAPRLGFAYNPTESGTTVIRGGIGKFYDYHLLNVRANLDRFGVFSQAFVFNPGEDLSADRGAIPTSHVCLQPSLNGRLAAISPACRAFLTNLRNSLTSGATPFINVEPQLDTPDRVMGYLWGYSLGVQRQIMANVALGVDYIGNRGRDRMRQIDISEGAPGPNGRIVRLTPAQFDPAGTLIPASARNTSFLRVLQNTISDDFDSDFESLEVSLEKRFSNRWSGRMSYTLAYSNDVPVRVSNDRDPRMDYGRSNQDNRHSFVTSFSVTPWGGLTVGTIFRAYSGYPINETIGSDVNGDRDNIDRPVRGVHDLTRPILSAVDSNRRAVRNGIDGEGTKLLDLSVQYIRRLPSDHTAGFFWEAYNVMNWVNYGNPTGNRNSANFMVPVVAGRPIQMQIGVRHTF